MKGWVLIMTEKLYKKIKTTGTISLVTGIIMLVFGVATGVMLIVNGGRLLSHKADTLF